MKTQRHENETIYSVVNFEQVLALSACNYSFKFDSKKTRQKRPQKIAD